MKSKFVFLLLGVFLISMTSAWSEDAFNNSLTAENLMFTGDENITRWLSVPEDIVVTNAFLDISGRNFDWEVSPEIINGIVNPAEKSVPAVFSDGTNLHAIITDWTSISGYTWNGTGWTVNATVISGIAGQTRATSAIFNVGNKINLIQGNRAGQYSGYTWNGSGWVVNSTLVSGITDVDDYGGVVVINVSNTRYLFTAGWSPEESHGYVWNGAGWTANSTIENGIDFFSYPVMSFTNIFGTPLIFWGSGTGTTQTNEWNGTKWNLNNNYSNDIGNVGSWSSPYFFEHDNKKYMMVGEDVGTINGFVLNLINNSYLRVGNISGINEWNYTGEFSGLEETSNFAQTINSFISQATAIAGFYLVPFLFHSDTVGILNYFNLIFNNFGFFENSQTFSPAAASGAIETFSINLTYDSNFYSGISADLVYNGTTNQGASSENGDSITFSKNIIIPNVDSPVNITFYWNVTLSNTTGSFYFLSDENNQTISPLLFDNCTTFTNELLSFEMVDEDSLDEINGTIEVTLNVFSLGTSNLVNTFSSSFDYVIGEDSKICLDNITEEYSMSYQIRHFGDEAQYFKKYRNIQLSTINNETLSQNITLYNLNLSRGHSFNVIVVGNLLSSVGNSGLLVDTQRQYLATNEFRSVESPVTDSSGVAIANLVETEEIYNFLISFNGELLGTFNNYQVKCANAALGQCSITLNLATATGGPTDFDTIGGITQLFLLNTDTNVLHHTFSVTDGNSKTVRSLVIKNDGYANETICNNSVSGTSGTILCPIPVAFRNESIMVQTFVDGEMIGTKIFYQGPDVDWQGADILIMLLMFSSLVLLFIGHPITIVIGAILGLTMPVLLISVAGASFGVLFGATLFYIAGGIVAIIVMSKKKNI